MKRYVRLSRLCVRRITCMALLPLAMFTVLQSQAQCPFINVTVTTTNLVCRNDSTGSLVIEASGGAAPYEYRILRTGTSGATWENYQTSNVYNNLPWGQYIITIKDANGCTRLNTRLLTYKSTGPIIAAILKQDAICHNSQTGSIYITTVTGINRTTPYTYTWTGVPSNTPTAPALAAGAYTVRVADSLGCYSDSTITITQPEPLKTTFETGIICMGATNGQIALKAGGGVAPYTYNVNGAAWQAATTFTGLTAGSHTVRTKDANTCIDSFKVTIPDRNRVNTYVDFAITGNQNVSDTVLINQKCLPIPDSVKWEFPSGTMVVDNNQFAPRLRLNTDGTFKVKMIPYFGNCNLPVEKEFKIKQQHNIFDAALVTPNPNSGSFTLKVQLSRKQPLHAYLRTVTGTLVYYKRWEATREIIETISMDNAGTIPRGVYYLKLITDNDVRDIIVVKQ
ncbi:MAG: SprB repeat-containing protein [Niastella sp.]|nr:SprB repeat-containing protein [Niastella sp.]